jgi:hypothetical protein
MDQFTYVSYFIPVDGDAEEAPNVFVIRKPAASITLDDVKQVPAAARCPRRALPV